MPCPRLRHAVGGYRYSRGPEGAALAAHPDAAMDALKPLPDEPVETGRWITPRVDMFSQVTVRTNRYAVPARLIGRRVRALLHASELVVYDGPAEAARHERLMARAGVRLDLDHCLELGPVWYRG